MGMKAIGMLAGGFETALLRMELRRVGGRRPPGGRDRAGHRDRAVADRRRPGGGAARPGPGGAGRHRVPRRTRDRVDRQPVAAWSAAAALAEAADRLHDKIIALAAHRLEAAPADLEIVGSVVRVKGDPQASLPLREIATSAWRGWDLPEGCSPGAGGAGLRTTRPTTPTPTARTRRPSPSTRRPGRWSWRATGWSTTPVSGEPGHRRRPAPGRGGPGHRDGADGGGRLRRGRAAGRRLPAAHRVRGARGADRLAGDALADHPGRHEGRRRGRTISPPAAIGNAVAAALPEIADRVTDTPITPQTIWRLLSSSGG